MLSFDKSEIITCKSYYSLCDYIFGAGYTPNTVCPPEGVVHCALDEIGELFRLIEGNGKKYIVISSCSDYGLFYQQEHPVWQDMIKWVKMQVGPMFGYSGVRMPPRCDVRHCDKSHKYSIKMYAWTKNTFDHIPDNILYWFVVNNGIMDNPRIEGIPFGIAEGEADLFANLDRTQKRDKLAYVNWGLHTYERLIVKSHFAKLNSPYFTVVKDQIQKPEYIRDLLSHKFILCPNGNGIDCYRTLESIYAGALPVVEDNPTTRQFADMPCVFASDLIDLKPDVLEEIWQNHQEVTSSGSNGLERATLSYWKRRVSEKKRELIGG